MAAPDPRRARIAIVTELVTPHGGGGVSSAHFSLCQLLRRQGYRHVELFPFVTPLTGLLGLAVRLLRQLLRRGLGLLDGALAWECPDIVRGAAMAQSALAALDDYRPDIVIAPDHGAPLLAIRKPSGCRWVLVSHHNPMRFVGVPGLPPHSLRDARWAVALENRVCRRVDAVVCPTAYMAEQFRRTYRSNAPLAVIPNLVDFDYLDGIGRVSVAARLGLPEQAVIFYLPSLGSQIKGRGHARALLQALAERYRGMSLGCYVSGAPLDAADCPTGMHLYMPGRLDYGSHLALVRSCTVCVSPTLVENFGMALAESVALGVPVVSFDVGGNREWLPLDACGTLVAPGDVPGLAEAARPYALAQDRDALQERVRRRAREQLAPEPVAARWEALLSDVLAQAEEEA